MRKILFIVATHGDEGFSVDTLEDLEKVYDRENYSYDWIIGNPLALERSSRFIDKDLNRSAPGNLESKYYEVRRAAEIVHLSQNYDVVIDIHGSVAACGVVTIIPYPTADNVALAKSIPVKRNVVWYAEELAINGPLAQYTLCPAVEIECGPKSSQVIQEQLKQVVKTIIVTNLNGKETNLEGQEFYFVYGAELGEPDGAVEDFKEISRNGERFYPFLSANQYEGTLCYKLKLVSEEEVLL